MAVSTMKWRSIQQEVTLLAQKATALGLTLLLKVRLRNSPLFSIAKNLKARYPNALLDEFQIIPILKAIRNCDSCDLLVFGLGYDSPLWVEWNTKGRTVFIEDNQDWIQQIGEKWPHLNAVKVTYPTRISSWRELINEDNKLNVGLASEITEKKWDIILVDGPLGDLNYSLKTYGCEPPGRMCSIYLAAQLIKPGGTVFVDDCDREVERTYADRYLGHNNLICEVNSRTLLREYRSPKQQHTKTRQSSFLVKYVNPIVYVGKNQTKRIRNCALYYSRYLNLLLFNRNILTRYNKTRIVIYTTIFGGKDKLREPYLFSSAHNIEYICFTDRAQAIKGWEAKRVSLRNNNPRLTARYYKLNPHLVFPDFEYSLWVDATHIPIIDVRILIEEFLSDSEIAAFKHPWRNCLYDEAQACINQGKDNIDIINNQVEQYRLDGYPRGNGLIASMVLLRRHNSNKCASLMSDWWKEVSTKSVRDQLSFNYMLHKHKIKIRYFSGHCYKSSWFAYLPHEHDD